MIDIHAGTQLDHYRIDSFVSSGRTTSLYRAEDLDTGTPVAIKIPHVNMEVDSVFVERFHREEEIGLTLDHPGVMKVLPNPHRTELYMVLEWLDGRILREVISTDGKLAPKRAVRIALGICEALDYIHSHGIVHRDLRPEHVMVLAEDHIKLMDFGLAGQVGARRVTFTNLAEIISNGNYLSPEQIAGNRGDARSDLYALGVILYELLTGKLPYGNSSSLEQFNSRALRDPVPMRSLDPTISPELEETVRRALERDPAHRYATAREFAHDLAHPETVTIDKNRGRESAKPLRPAKSKTSRVSIVIYALLAAIPALIFLAILITSRHK